MKKNRRKMNTYSSHDWRKNTDDAVVIDANTLNKMPVNDSLVRFKNPKTLKVEEVEVSRLIRVFVNNQTAMRKSIK
jgi:hypothetical protein